MWQYIQLQDKQTAIICVHIIIFHRQNQIPKKYEPSWKCLEIELLLGPASSFLGIYPNDLERKLRKDICTPMFLAALSTIAKIFVIQVTKNRWLNKETTVHIQNGILCSHEIKPWKMCWLGPECVMLSKLIQREWHRMLSLIWGI